MSAEAFFDTNILIYAASNDLTKSRRSEEILIVGGVVSVQVLNEFANAARRKQKADWNTIRDRLAKFRVMLSVEPVTEATHERGVELAERYGFALYDAMIVAAAQLAGCTTLFSEDMQDGQVIGGLTIRNPYA